MIFLVGFMAGAVVGVTAGALTLALCFVARDDEERKEKE